MQELKEWSFCQMHEAAHFRGITQIIQKIFVQALIETAAQFLN